MDIKTLKSEIKPLTFKGGALSSIESAYAKYYSIDAANLLPDISHELGYLDCQGYRIACHIYRPATPKGTFFLLHGYYDHVGLFKHIIRYLLEQGFCVFAYDLPGHGLSSGESASIPDFSIYTQVLATILKVCTDKMPKPWHAYGQSTGCAILTDYLLDLARQQKPAPFNQVVLSAPLVRPYLWKLGRIQLYILRPFLKQIPRQFSKNSRDQAFLAFAKEDPLAPRTLPVAWVNAMDRWIRSVEESTETIPISPLIIQGTDDKTVDACHNIPVLKQLYKNPEILHLEDARHHLPNELEHARTQYMNWLSTFL